MNKVFISVIITILAPVTVSIAWVINQATLGTVFVSIQVALLTYQLQKFWWSEADYRSIQKVLSWKKPEVSK